MTKKFLNFKFLFLNMKHKTVKCKTCGASHYTVIVTEYIEVEGTEVKNRWRTVTEVVCEECLNEIRLSEEVREYEDMVC